MQYEIVDEQNNVVNRISADAEYMQENYPEGNYNLVPSPSETTPPPVWEWYIDIGPFVDRFGTKSLALDTSTDPIVQAFSKDLSRRKWINLQDPRVSMTLGYLAGVTVPGIGTIAAPILTPAEVTDILTAPVTPEENLALRKQYFP